MLNTDPTEGKITEWQNQREAVRLPLGLKCGEDMVRLLIGGGKEKLIISGGEKTVTFWRGMKGNPSRKRGRDWMRSDVISWRDSVKKKGGRRGVKREQECNYSERVVSFPERNDSGLHEQPRP